MGGLWICHYLSTYRAVRHWTGPRLEQGKATVKPAVLKKKQSWQQQSTSQSRWKRTNYWKVTLNHHIHPPCTYIHTQDTLHIFTLSHADDQITQSTATSTSPPPAPAQASQLPTLSNLTPLNLYSLPIPPPCPHQIQSKTRYT